MGDNANNISQTFTSFAELPIDARLLKAICKIGWSTPTPVQARGIPLGLEGKDIFTKAKTGSGKTAVYLIPMLQRILAEGSSNSIRGVVMVPSKELSIQANYMMKQMARYCSKEIKSIDVSGDEITKKCIALEAPNIVIGTPSKLLSFLKSKTISFENLICLAIDEADLIFSFGYEEDFNKLVTFLPTIYQCFLMSATLSHDVRHLKKIILHNPIILKLKDCDIPESARLTQYYILAEREDKFLLVYSLLKLALLNGKTLIFVNKVENGYHLKLFFEKFSMRSCVLNSELPQNSRCHIIEEFNKGAYDIIIATDSSLQSSKSVHNDENVVMKRKKKDSEFSVSRGIDFQDINNVINFDFPLSIENYIHRVGRTARGLKSGIALSFVSQSEEKNLKKLEASLSKDEEKVLKPFQFKMEEIEGFKYRVQAAIRSVNRFSIKKARIKEIRTEIINSEKLHTYFENNPRELAVLRHDKHLNPAHINPQLKHIPPYLIPKSFRPTTQPNYKKQPRKTTLPYKAGFKTKYKRQKNNPLKTFSLKKTKKR